MEQARKMIATILELNGTSDRNMAQLTPSLVGMFGSLKLLNAFLSDLDLAFEQGIISAPLKKRAANLADTFVPQVAGYNGIKELSTAVTLEQLRSVRSDSPDSRIEGAVIMLGALMTILAEVKKIR